MPALWGYWLLLANKLYVFVPMPVPMLAMSPAEGYKPRGTPLRLPLPLVTVTFPEEPFHFSAVPTAPRLPVENPTIWLTMNGVAVAFCATNAATVTAQANAAS